MNEDGKREVKRALEELRRDLEKLVARHSSGLSQRSVHPYAAELGYHLTRLSGALDNIRAGRHSLELYSHRGHAELLAQIDTVMAQTKEVYEMAERAREVLLRPPPEDKEPGFTE